MAQKLRFHSRMSRKPIADVPGVRSAGYGDARTYDEAVASAARINDRTRRDQRESKVKAKDAYLAGLLPRWDADDEAGA